jgi:hypothetical protein
MNMNGGESQNLNLAGPPQPQGVSEKVLFSWNGPSFMQSEKTTRWYLMAGLVILGIIGYSAWQKDWFVIGVAIIVSAILFWYTHAMVPQDVNYRLTPMGVYVDEKFYPFSEMHSFWMVYNQSVKSLYIVFRKKYLPALVINIEKLDPLVLKGYLLKKLPEQESRGESLVDKFTRIAGL